MSGSRLLISNIDIDIDTIDDTFEVSISISTILTYKSIDRGIDDTFLVFFYRYYDIDTSQLTCKMMHITFQASEHLYALSVPLCSNIRRTSNYV